MQVDEPQVGPGSSAGKPSAAKAKQKKAPFYKAKAEARSSGEVQADRFAVILTEGRGASRPGKQDDQRRLSHQKLGALKKPGLGMRVMRQPAQESQECALWLLSKKNSSLTTRFTSRWCSSRVSNQCFLSRI